MGFIFKIACGLLFLSLNAQALIPSPVVSKICNYDKLNKKQKTDFIKHAFTNFLPANVKQELSRGISNFSNVAKNNEAAHQRTCGQKGAENKKLCQKAIKMTDTSYRYDVEMTLNEIEGRINLYRPALKEVFQNCGDVGDTLDKMLEELDPSTKIKGAIAKGDFDKAREETEAIAGILDIKLQAKRVHNPKTKKDPFSRKKVYDGGSLADCGENVRNHLSVMDKIHLKTLGFLGKVVSTFSPEAPKVLSEK